MQVVYSNMCNIFAFTHVQSRMLVHTSILTHQIHICLNKVCVCNLLFLLLFITLYLMVIFIHLTFCIPLPKSCLSLFNFLCFHFHFISHRLNLVFLYSNSSHNLIFACLCQSNYIFSAVQSNLFFYSRNLTIICVTPTFFRIRLL